MTNYETGHETPLEIVAERDTPLYRKASKMREQCQARLSLILPGEDYPSVVEYCEKSEGHRDYHGSLSGYCWHAS